MAAYNTISGRLNAAQLVIANTLHNPAIADRVAARGYTANVMAEGQRLCDAAKEAADAQAAAAGAQRLATERARAAEKQARMHYQGLVQTVRAVFPRNAPQRKALEVTGRALNDSAMFIAAATTLFNNALAIGEIAAVLARYGYDAATLRGERESIDAFQRALQAQARAMSAAKQATRAQTEALAALHRWVTLYVKIVRIALRSEPELLKALEVAGLIRQTSTRRSTQPKATAQAA